jgi:hypothetical protein
MQMEEQEVDIQESAEYIDSLLDADDGSLLAAIAFYKASVIELFGRDGIVEMLKNAVDNAANVDYFSRRSRREIDPARPSVNLKVDHKAVIDTHNALKARFAGRDMTSKSVMTELKAAIIHEQVCQPLASYMSEKLAPHWATAKSHVTKKYSEEAAKKLSLLICNIFSVRINDEPNSSGEYMCALVLFI